MAEPDDTKRTRITFTASAPQLKALDREAKELDLSQQELIRRILDAWRLALPKDKG